MLMESPRVHEFPPLGGDRLRRIGGISFAAGTATACISVIFQSKETFVTSGLFALSSGMCGMAGEARRELAIFGEVNKLDSYIIEDLGQIQ